jgi:hypothetical protein
MDGTSDNRSHHNTSTSSPLTDVLELRRDHSSGIADLVVDSESELSMEDDSNREGKHLKESEDLQNESSKKQLQQSSSTDDSGDHSRRKKSDTLSEDERGKNFRCGAIKVPFLDHTDSIGRKSRRDSVASGQTTPLENDEGVYLPDRKRPVPFQAVNQQDRSGRTLIFKYASRGDVDSTEALLRAGASLRIADYAGWTPLHEACLEGHTEIVRLMLAFDADVDCPGGDGDTPLHDAVGNVHFEVVKLLLRHGASIDLVNEQGQTALEFALEKWKESSSDFVELAHLGQE